MKLLTEDAVLICGHPGGKVNNQPSQSFVTIGHKRVLVANDPQGWSISNCSNISVNMKPCQATINVTNVKGGYSTFLSVGGHAICLDTITGLTDGTPPGGVNYTVRSPGQDFVTGSA